MIPKTRKLSLLFSLLLLVPSVVSAEALHAPKLKLDSLCYDLGILVMDTVFHEINVGFVNEGDAGLVFFKPRVSCECLQVEVPKDTIPAGKSGIIKVRLDMGSFSMPNKQLRSMRIYSNDLCPQEVDFIFETIYKVYEPNENTD